MPLLFLLMPLAALAVFVLQQQRRPAVVNTPLPPTQSPGVPPSIDATYTPPAVQAAAELAGNLGGLGAGADAASASIASEPAARGLVDSLAYFVEGVSDSARSVFNLPAKAAPYADAINAAQARYRLPDSLLARILQRESDFNANARGSSGELGIAQFMPATARELGVDPLNPTDAIDGAGRYLRQLFDILGDWTQAVAAYNWGIGKLQRNGIARAPARTLDYVAEVTKDVVL